jgi:hypothetical protein
VGWRKMEKKKVEISFGDDIKRIQNEKISKIIKALPGIENAKKKFSLGIFYLLLISSINNEIEKRY